MKKLINEGENINAKGDSGFTPLHLAVISLNIQAVNLLIEKKADIHTRDNGNSTPLHWAANVGFSEAVGILINKGAIIDATNCQMETPLHWAIKGGKSETALLLMEKGAGIELKNEIGYRALHWAVINNQIEVVKRLIQKGADVNALTDLGASPLDLIVYGHDDLWEIPLREFKVQGDRLFPDAIKYILIEAGGKAHFTVEENTAEFTLSIPENLRKKIRIFSFYGFEVKLKNISGNDLIIWNNASRSGCYNLYFIITTEKNQFEKFKVGKSFNRVWTESLISIKEIKVSESIGFIISRQDQWNAWGEITVPYRQKLSGLTPELSFLFQYGINEKGTDAEIIAVFESGLNEEAHYYKKRTGKNIWIGRVESKPLKIKIFP